MKLYMTFLEEPVPFNIDKVNGQYTSAYPRPIFASVSWMDLMDKMRLSFEVGTDYYIGEVSANDYEICEWLEKALNGKEICLNPAKTEIIGAVRMKVFQDVR